jgi:hypothetical protein
VFLDPDKLNEYSPAEVLDAAAHGHLGLDHRFFHALLDRREEALPALLAFAERDRSADTVDLAPELIEIFRTWRTPEALPFFISYIKEDPLGIPDALVEAVVELGTAALEPLLVLYEELDESESGEIAFMLANLGIREERILEILLDRLEYDLSDTVFLLGSYGDSAAKPALEAALAEVSENDTELTGDIAEVLEDLETSQPVLPPDEPSADEIWRHYPEKEDLPVELLDEETRLDLLAHPVASVRAAAAASFFNRELNAKQRQKMLEVAQHDESATVRARAWEALMLVAPDNIEVVEAMLSALRRSDVPVEERGGLLVGLASEADRNEVRQAMVDLYQDVEGRAKALEGMWRSVHPSFREYFAKHLDDADVEIRRSAIWGVGYYGVKSELDHLRNFFEDDELRSDALFAYALAIPSEVSRGRMKGLLARIEKDARGLSLGEEELVKAALDERLILAGKEPVFVQQED